MRFDAVQTIKDRLTMQDVLLKYGYSPKRRMPCPIHNGKDCNFEIKGNNWRCYSRCGSGDTISFVQQLFNISFQDALRKIDTDFGLNIYGDHSFEELRRSHYQQQALKAKQEREKREKQIIEAKYWEAFSEWKRLDDNLRLYAPKAFEEKPHPFFIESLQKIEYQKYILDVLDDRRKRYV